MGGRWYELQEGALRFLMEARIRGPAGVPLALAAGAGRLALGCSGGCIATVPMSASLDPQACICARADKLTMWGNITACCQYTYLSRMCVIQWMILQKAFPQMNRKCFAWAGTLGGQR